MSSDVAIAVHNLSKWFELGLSGRRESLLSILERRVRHPFTGSATKRERFCALDDVNFDVHQGEAVGVIGRNGAGKSTLLKILSRITPPSAGTVDLTGTVGSLLEVGTGFHPELTGLENVYLNGTILGMTKQAIDQRLDEIVEFAEVSRFLETPVKRYSNGMRVRLAFAVAAHLDPEILIVDEVLSVGDARFQAKCLDKMRSVASDQGRTVLYVSHNLVTVENLCPRSILLGDGQVVFDGDTKGALAKYTSTIPRAEQGWTPGVFDLAAADRSSHHGSHELLKRLEMRPNGGALGDTVRMGERLHVEVVVEGLDTFPDAGVGIMVGSPTVRRLFRFTERIQPLPAAHDRCSVERIVVDIPWLSLTPGDYHFDVGIYDVKTGALIDEVAPAAEFTVIASDVFGTAYPFTSWDGEFVIPWTWELRPDLDSSAAGGADAGGSRYA